MPSKRTPGPGVLIKTSRVAPLLAGLTLLLASPALAASAPKGTSAPAHHPTEPPANPTWTHPFTLAGPYPDDILPAQVAFSQSGEAAVSYAVYAEDAPQDSQGYVTTRAVSGKLGHPRKVPNSQEILDLAFDGSVLELLSANSPFAFPCCSGATAMTFNNNRFGHGQKLASALDGSTLGVLTPLANQRMLAAIAAPIGVYVAQSPAVGHYRSSRRLTELTEAPETLAATSLPKGRSAVAWTAATVDVFDVPTNAIELATGTDQKAPSTARVAITVAAGHGIDELALASSPEGPTAAWVESWFDSAGTYHSEVVVADLSGKVRTRAFAVPGQIASDISFASDAKGDQALAWKVCTLGGACSVRAASRPAHKHFGAVQQLGSAEPGQAPTAAVAPDGDAVLGWIDATGHVVVASRRGTDGRFGSLKTLSSSTLGADLTLAFGPADQALAVWTEGTVSPSVVGDFFG